jgi:hypothetical protein
MNSTITELSIFSIIWERILYELDQIKYSIFFSHLDKFLVCEGRNELLALVMS